MRSRATPDAATLDDKEICRRAVDAFIQHRDIEFSAIFLRAESTKLLQQAKRDPLTGLLNRFGFMQELEVAISHAMAEGEAYGILYVDIDRFRIVNDAGGQAAAAQDMF